MKQTTQFSLRIEPELIRKIDDAAQKEYKNRTEFIKEAVQLLLKEKEEKDHFKRIAAELWLKRELPESKLRKVLRDEEVKDLKFGRKWVEEAVDEARS